MDFLINTAAYFVSFNYSMLVRLVIAAILGGLIGWERGEKSNQEAGLRTHIIVCLGAALVMIISESITLQHGSGDVLRMGAQVISGIGFLGVGCIIVTGNKVRGITTAAGLWTTAIVGLAVGSGHYVLATIVVALMLFAMLGLRAILKKRAKLSKNDAGSDAPENAEINFLLEKLTEMETQISSLKTEIKTYERKED